MLDSTQNTTENLQEYCIACVNFSSVHVDRHSPRYNIIALLPEVKCMIAKR